MVYTLKIAQCDKKILGNLNHIQFYKPCLLVAQATSKQGL